MTEASGITGAAIRGPSGRSPRSLLRSIEIDTRLLGMIGALAIIWIGFNIMSGGLFLTARNLWNLSVQSSSIAIMATGMVLVIVSRNIDLSVGSLLGFLGYTMAMVQAIWIPTALGLGFYQPYTWVVALLVGVLLGAALGGFQGFIVAYGGVPSFIVTLGGFLVWRGLIFQYAQGQTIAPMDSTYALLGGGPIGSLGDVGSWVVGALACAGIVYSVIGSRRRRQRYGFPVRPTWALVTVIVAGSAAVLGAVWIANNYFWPPALATQYALDHGITEPPGGLQIPVGIAYPVLLMIAVAIVMTIIATRRRFGRYAHAIGAVTNLGVQNELDVISAAVIGGTSFSGGIGTIPGAVLGAVVMQSLRSGMVLLRVDSPTQDIVVGIVLVTAVGLDTFVRRRATR